MDTTTKNLILLGIEYCDIKVLDNYKNDVKKCLCVCIPNDTPIANVLKFKNMCLKKTNIYHNIIYTIIEIYY